MEISTVTHNLSKWREWEIVEHVVLNGTSVLHSLLKRLRAHLRREGGESIGNRASRYLQWSCVSWTKQGYCAPQGFMYTWTPAAVTACRRPAEHRVPKSQHGSGRVLWNATLSWGAMAIGGCWERECWFYSEIVTSVDNLMPCMFLETLVGLSELFKNKQTKQQQQQQIEQRKGKVWEHKTTGIEVDLIKTHYLHIWNTQ